MDILVTFEDGSSAYLEHHGVRGMHWGVRNAETQAKYAGGQGRAQRRSDLRSSRMRTANATNKLAINYINKNNEIANAKRSGKITKNQARIQRIKNADSYESKFYAERAKGRNEQAKIKAEGKSNKAKARIMGRAASKNTYEKTTSKGTAYARRQSTGKRVAKNILLGNSGYASYNSARAAGKNRLKSMGYAVAGDAVGGSLYRFDAYAQSQGSKAKKQVKAKYKK